MSKDLVRKGSDITADLPPVKITREDIKKHFCLLATDTELAMGLAIVKSLKLNPFLRECHFIKYSQKDKMQIVVGYEVYLKRAERTGKLDGWKAGINAAENYSWVKIWRKDWKEPFEWTVNLNEFDKKQSTWKQIPSFMGRKVAIAQGFRLAFPDELGGMPYTEEEHQVYDIDVEPQNVKPEVSMPKELPAPVNGEIKHPEIRMITKKEGEELIALAEKQGYTKNDLKQQAEKLGYEKLRDVNNTDLPTLIDYVTKMTKQERDDLEKV